MRVEIIVSKHKGNEKPPPKHAGKPAPEPTPPQQ
ncbi:hypothetical protein P3T27_004566 [Kitasatospora sp. MAA19]|nr:hypothetical protein [Kitasatospora sp. MAA19]